MIQVDLTFVEIILAAHAGILRRVESLKKGRSQNQAIKNNLWEIDVIGSIGELAFAKYMGFYWANPMGTFKLPDLPGYQVRSTNYSSGSLIVREGDNSNDYYVLALTGSLPKVFLPGGIVGRKAKRTNISFLDPDRPGCYVVKQKDLEPLENLKKETLANEQTGRETTDQG